MIIRLCNLPKEYTLRFTLLVEKLDVKLEQLRIKAQLLRRKENPHSYWAFGFSFFVCLKIELHSRI